MAEMSMAVQNVKMCTHTTVHYPEHTRRACLNQQFIGPISGKPKNPRNQTLIS